MGSMRAGIDIGGAFTDLVIVDSDGGLRWVKVDTSPDLLGGVINAFKVCGVDLGELSDIIHGHTVAINAVTTGSTARVGLVTTKGFRDVLEVQRGNRRDVYNFRYRKPKPLVPRYLRVEVDERMDSKGGVIRRFSPTGLEGIIELFRQSGVQSVAVSLVNSYVNGSHEVEVGKWLEKSGFKYITLSHEISQVWREYERTSTAVLNAAVQPVVAEYLSKLEEFLYGSGFKGNFYIVTSTGGHVSASFARRYPIFTLESGPAAGVIGAIRVAQRSFRTRSVNIIALDGGSTTTKASLVQGGELKIVNDYSVGERDYWPGYPVSIPIIDVVEVGVGGTSLVSVDGGDIRVGPQAAGSYPGPACYGRGGVKPTLTDAYVVNGFIDPDNFLGGRLPLNRDLALSSIGEIAARFGMGVNDAADGVIRLANESAAYAIRLVSVQRGYDPRDFVLVAYGGSGPMFASFIARELQTSILIPAVPLGNFSAWGMLMGGVRHDLVKTVQLTLRPGCEAALEGEFRALEGELRRMFSEEGKAEPNFARFAEMKYVGQGHTLRVALPAEIREGGAESITELFHARHEQEFSFRMDSPVEVVNIHSVGFLPPTTADMPVYRGGTGSPRATRKIYVDGAWREAAIYSRGDLKVGQRISGPAIVEEETSTIIILEDQVANVDSFGNIVINNMGD